jgi:hypothetical protein
LNLGDRWAPVGRQVMAQGRSGRRQLEGIGRQLEGTGRRLEGSRWGTERWLDGPAVATEGSGGGGDGGYRIQFPYAKWWRGAREKRKHVVSKFTYICWLAGEYSWVVPNSHIYLSVTWPHR